jgi:hypothetical protein
MTEKEDFQRETLILKALGAEWRLRLSFHTPNAHPKIATVFTIMDIFMD